MSIIFSKNFLQFKQFGNFSKPTYVPTNSMHACPYMISYLQIYVNHSSPECSAFNEDNRKYINFIKRSK